jgi:hypothetical protein
MSMEELFAENSFAHKDPARHGLYPLLSRFNHSCIPNCKVPEFIDGTSRNGVGAISSFATEEIAYGEEITFCHNDNLEGRARSDRHRELCFVCDCRACTLGTPFQKLSDMRRIFIRGLNYLTQGRDIDYQKDTSRNPLILNPALKKAAEEMKITISAKLVYILLSMVLVEQEGLLDAFEVKRMEPGIVLVVNLFRGEEIARVARLAVAQESWVEKFLVALELFWREDDADVPFAMLLRMERGMSG